MMDTPLRDDEIVIEHAARARIYYQKDKSPVRYSIRAELWLTSERLVGQRRTFRRTQIAPDIPTGRITEVSTTSVLRMRKAVTRLGSKRRFVQLAVEHPAMDLGIVLPADDAARWAEAIGFLMVPAED